MAIVIVADDLSGAAELAGIAFARGLTAEVQRLFEPGSAADVIAVDSDTRHLDAEQAADRTASLAREIVASQPAWIYKKVDSVLRGNVRVVIEAALKATGRRRAVLISANPSRGRTILDGRYLVNGVPLDQTQLARDPEHPRQSSHIVELLGGEVPPTFLVPNVTSQDDLTAYARELDDHTLAAGAADFFAALLGCRCGNRSGGGAGPADFILPRPALLVCGSRLAWAQRAADCLAAGVSVCTISQIFSGQTIDSESSAEWACRLASTGRLLLGIGDTDSPVDSQELLFRLAHLTALVLKHTPAAALLAEGGATAAAISTELGWQRFALSDQAPQGVGILQPLDQPQAPRFLIKPGSYPWADELWRQFAANSAR